MKTTLLSFFLLCFSVNSFGQLRVSFGGFYSTPLGQFCADDYSDGAGADLGLALVHEFHPKWSVEAGLNMQYGLNGKKTTELSLGDYDLKNSFLNWQIKVNLVKRIGKVSPYVGFAFGGGTFYTNEYIAFNEPQENQVNYYDNFLHETFQFNQGAQIGTYVHLNDFIDLNLGVSFIKSHSKVKYIDFESFTFDGTEIDYEEKMSVPFLLLINVGISFKFKPILSSDYSGSYSDRGHYTKSRYNRSSSSSSCEPSSRTSKSSSSSSGTSSNEHYKKKTAPKLIKNGKTPVGFK